MHALVAADSSGDPSSTAPPSDSTRSRIPLNDVARTDNELVAVLDRMVESRLELLADPRLTPGTREEIINWIAAPLVPEPQVAKRPFSFQACCYGAGLDPEVLQVLTLKRVAPERLKELLRR